MAVSEPASRHGRDLTQRLKGRSVKRAKSPHNRLSFADFTLLSTRRCLWWRCSGMTKSYIRCGKRKNLRRPRALFANTTRGLLATSSAAASSR